MERAFLGHIGLKAMELLLRYVESTPECLHLSGWVASLYVH